MCKCFYILCLFQMFCFPYKKKKKKILNLNHYQKKQLFSPNLTHFSQSIVSKQNSDFIKNQNGRRETEGEKMIDKERADKWLGKVITRRRILQYYFRRMNFAFFPLREFTEALGVTAKVKSRLEPFLDEVENSNMEWMFQMMMELYTYTTSPDVPLHFKFNSLVALKLLLDTCEFPVVLMTEVYFLPHIRKVATYQLQATEKQRGLDYFLNQGYPRESDTKKLGYNYVRLASEIVTMMAKVKPYRLFRAQELTQASDFANALQIMRAQQWREYDLFAFYQEDEHQLRQIYLQKLQMFSTHPDRYFDFLDTYLDKLIRKEYSPKVLDPRKIFEAGEAFACDFVLDALKEMLAEQRLSIKVNVLRLFTDFVRWGYIRATYLIEVEGIFDPIILHAKSKGKAAFRNQGGTEEERRSLFVELVRSIQVWAVCIPKDPMNLMAESKSSILYKEFLAQKIQVPYSRNIKKIRDQCDANLQRNQLVNLYIMKEFKKHDFDASKMRRSSSNLEELINLDRNIRTSMASLLMQAKLISDIQQTPDDSTSSVTTHTSTPGLSNTDPNFPNHSPSSAPPSNAETSPAPPPSPKQNKTQFVKQSFRHRYTVSLGRLIPGRCDVKCPDIKGTHCLPEIDNQNYDEDCQEHFQINNMRNFESKDRFPTMQLSFKKQLKPTQKGLDHEEDIQFFEEVIRSNTPLSSQSVPNNSLSNFVINVSKPLPLQENHNMLKSVPSPRKDKATSIHPDSQNRSVKLTCRPRYRNDMTAIPQKKEKESGRSWTLEGQDSLKWSCSQFIADEDDRDCMSYDLKAIPVERCINVDQQRYLPFLKDFPSIEGRKMLRNKDLLVKTSKIQIGFIFEARSAHTGILTLFITPEEAIRKLRLELNCSAAVSCNGPGEGFSEIAKHKQRRLPFEFTIRLPYSLPKLTIGYEMEGKQHTHILILPISFNKFVKFSPPSSTFTVPTSIIKTSKESINPDYQQGHIMNFFQGFSLKQLTGGISQVSGRGEWGGVNFRIAFILQNGLSVQIKCEVEGKGDCEAVQFLMAVLLAIFRK